ncbi:MAG: glycerophosphodiester phosphodiesterase family protein [Thiogranum sp.]
MSEQPVPQLVAHRGYMEQYPENTWTGLEAALSAGACWLEFDVQMCADGRFVLLHDADFRRTGNDTRSVFTTDSQALRGISVHEPARLGERFFPAMPPELDTVLQRLSAFPAARAMVEIKDESLDYWGTQKVMDALLDILTPFRQQCTLIAYSDAALSCARQRGDYDTGWVLRSYDRQHLERAAQLEPRFLICNERKIPPGETPWRGDWQWMLYDISEPHSALQWAARGVQLIETRDIGTMLQHPLLARRACRHGL